MNSSIKYQIAADKATAEGFRHGSHEWWDAIRYHMAFPRNFAMDPPENILMQRQKEAA